MTLNLILTFDVIITSNSVLSLARLSLRLNLNFKHIEELTSAVFKSLRIHYISKLERLHDHAQTAIDPVSWFDKTVALLLSFLCLKLIMGQ